MATSHATHRDVFDKLLDSVVNLVVAFEMRDTQYVV